MTAPEQLPLEWPASPMPLGTWQREDGLWICHRWIESNRYAYALAKTREDAERQADDIIRDSLATGRTG